MEGYEKYNFTWIIENFSLCQKEQSVMFTTSTLDRRVADITEWKLVMYPKGSNKDTRDYMSLYLIMLKSNDIELSANFHFYILSDDGEKKYAKETKDCNFNAEKMVSFDKFIKRDLLFNVVDELLPDDKLILSCNISSYYQDTHFKSFLAINKVEKYPINFMNDFSKMFESSELTDCIIKVGDFKINTHKLILATRSKVFRSIFQEDKFELNIVEINDFSSEVVKEMITYMYTENSPNLNEMAGELLMIAVKYNLRGLKSMAEENLYKRLNVENVCEYLEMGEVYKAKLLKKYCMAFIYKNANDVVKSDKWANFVIKYPLLLNDIFKFSMGVDEVRLNQ